MGDPSPPDGAQRKLVTVLVADVDEAVEAFADPDPEDVARLLAGPVARVRTEVEAFGGVVQETVGGRTVAVFGPPHQGRRPRAGRPRRARHPRHPDRGSSADAPGPGRRRHRGGAGPRR